MSTPAVRSKMDPMKAAIVVLLAIIAVLLALQLTSHPAPAAPAAPRYTFTSPSPNPAGDCILAGGQWDQGLQVCRGL